jgi:alkyl hydroperoxide reductase subunit AhpC
MRYFRCSVRWGLLLGGLASVVAASGCIAGGDPQVGSRIPPLTIKALSGKTANLKSLCSPGQALVLTFWRKFLPVTAAHLPAMERLNSRYSPKVTMVGFALDIDTKEDLEAYFQRLRPAPTFETCGSAVSKQVAEKCGVQSHPTVCVVNPEGVIAYVETGFGARTAAQIEEAIKKVLAGK